MSEVSAPVRASSDGGVVTAAYTGPSGHRRRRSAAVLTAGLLAVGGTSVLALSPAQAYPLQVEKLAANKTPHPGERLTVHGSGFAPGTRVRVLELPGPRVFKVVRANGAGAIAVRIRIPARLLPGKKRIEAVGALPGGGELVLSMSFTVKKKHPKKAVHGASDSHMPVAAITDFTVRHPAGAGVAGGGTIAALSGGGLLLARRRRSL